MSDDRSSENYVVVLSSGRVLDFLRRLALPVVALPGRTIFRVNVRGSGIHLPVEGSGPIVAFLSIHFVATKTVREAEEKAIESVRARWEALYSDDVETLVTEVEECAAGRALPAPLASRSDLHSGGGGTVERRLTLRQ